MTVAKSRSVKFIIPSLFGRTSSPRLADTVCRQNTNETADAALRRMVGTLDGRIIFLCFAGISCAVTDRPRNWISQQLRRRKK